MNINKIVKDNIRACLNEAQERDPYVSVRPSQGTYAVTNAQDLIATFKDPARKIGKNAFVTVVYVEDANINATFKNGGYTDSDGNVMSAYDLEQQGRNLGKTYLNNFYDSDEFKRKLSMARGAKRPFAIFRTVTQLFNWDAMNYGKRLADIDAVFNNASDSDLNDFTANDADFGKRIVKFKEENPEMADEIDQYISMGTFPRDIINLIRKTPLSNNGGNWKKVRLGDSENSEESDFISQHSKTGNIALRLTKNSNLKKEYQSYIIFSNGDIRRISKDEYYHLRRAFGEKSKSTKTNPQEVQTSIRQAMNAICQRYEFRNYIIPQIAKMSFTIDGKPLTYKNHELNVGGIIIDADDFLNSPMAENKKHIMNKNKIKLTESQLHKVIKESVKKILRESDYMDDGDLETQYGKNPDSMWTYGTNLNPEWVDGLDPHSVRNSGRGNKKADNEASWDYFDAVRNGADMKMRHRLELDDKLRHRSLR